MTRRNQGSGPTDRFGYQIVIMDTADVDRKIRSLSDNWLQPLSEIGRIALQTGLGGVEAELIRRGFSKGTPAQVKAWRERRKARPHSRRTGAGRIPAATFQSPAQQTASV